MLLLNNTITEIALLALSMFKHNKETADKRGDMSVSLREPGPSCWLKGNCKGNGQILTLFITR